MSTGDEYTTDNPRYPEIVVDLSTQDGNSFFIIGRVASALRMAGVPASERMKFSEEAVAGNRDELLRTVMKWVSVE